MKKLKIIVFGMLLMFAGSAHSQLTVRLNLGTPPAWGPAGYDDVQYYYLPDIESYYDVRSSMFIYYSGNRWIHSRNLPSRYRNYDLYGGYKVPMSGYRGNTPYSNFREHRMKYARGYRGHEQRNIGERNGRNQVKNNDKGQGRGNDNNRGHGNEKKDDRERGNNR